MTSHNLLNRNCHLCKDSCRRLYVSARVIFGESLDGGLVVDDIRCLQHFFCTRERSCRDDDGVFLCAIRGRRGSFMLEVYVQLAEIYMCHSSQSASGLEVEARCNLINKGIGVLEVLLLVVEVAHDVCTERSVERYAYRLDVVGTVASSSVNIKVYESVHLVYTVALVHETFFLGVEVRVVCLFRYRLRQLVSRELHWCQRVAVILLVVESDVARVCNDLAVYEALDAVLFRKLESFGQIELRHEVAAEVSARLRIAHLADVAGVCSCQNRVGDD